MRLGSVFSPVRGDISVAQGVSPGLVVRLLLKPRQGRHTISPLRGLLIYSMLVPTANAVGY
ncbi:MAG: hypothetical protein QOJ02_482 [Acidobacteriota bacterium]|nr:hypothetical protein [Acidobacteriota bacterium]